MEIIHNEGPTGAEIRGVDLSAPLSDEVFGRIFAALCERSVIVFRGQRITPADLVAFTRRLGTPANPPLLDKYALAGHPEVLKVSNIVENGEYIGNPDAGLFWHSDGAYQERPSMYSLLYAVEVPKENGESRGDTLFTSTAAAHDGLDAATRERIAGLRALHSLEHQYRKKKAAAFLRRDDMSAEEQVKVVPPVSHPLVRRHPHTGRSCLFVNEGHTCGIEGMPQDEARALLDRLCADCVRPEYVYRHRWEPGDLVVWDNCATQHRATFDYALPLRRLMYRTTVCGDRPLAQA